MSYIVYKHTNQSNNKVYIGITSRTCEQRWGKNGEGYKLQPKFYNAILKYGWENFYHEILYCDLTQKEALKKESELIQKYDSIKNGYNVASFGTTSSKRIVCLTTQEIFDSIYDAALYGGVTDSNLSHYLQGDYDSCGKINGQKLKWEYLDLPEENLKAQQKREQRKQNRESKFYTEEAKEIVRKYQEGVSIRELSRLYHKDREGIKTILKFFNIEIISSEKRRSRKVIQLDNEKNFLASYNSLVEAARAIGISEGNTGRIKKACDEQWRKVKGYYWQWEF